MRRGISRTDFPIRKARGGYRSEPKRGQTDPPARIRNGRFLLFPPPFESAHLGPLDLIDLNEVAIRHSHAARCTRNGVIVNDVTSGVTRRHAERISEASASSFGGSALSLAVTAGASAQPSGKFGKF
jgi:hypothetical protein